MVQFILQLNQNRFRIIDMGNQNDPNQQRIALSLADYHYRKEYQLPWTGSFFLLKGKNNKKVIEKKLKVRNGTETQALMKRFNNFSSAPFYLIKPLHIEVEKEQAICSESSSLAIYHSDLLPSLSQKIESNGHNLSKQVTIWFILNEVVHSLEILYDKNIPHLWISPETIFYNENENWLLQDMSFWWGYDLQSLLQRKVQYPNQIISSQMKNNAIRNNIFDLEAAKDEDVYCLGYTILFVMTSIPFYVLSQVYQDILIKCRTNYSQKLVSLVSQMISPDSRKRVSFQRLKLKLKLDEEEIIDEQIREYQKSHHEGRRVSELTIYERSSISPIKTPLHSNIRMKTEQRTEARTQIMYSPMTDRSKLFTSPQPTKSLRKQKPVNIKHFRLGSAPKRDYP